jgi:hypothetical protein
VSVGVSGVVGCAGKVKVGIGSAGCGGKVDDSVAGAEVAVEKLQANMRIEIRAMAKKKRFIISSNYP